MLHDTTWNRALVLALGAMSLLIGSGGTALACCQTKTFNIAVGSWDGRGGVIAADVDDDGERDLIITQPSLIIAYRQSGTRLWSVASPNIQLSDSANARGLPGLHGAGVQAGDIDGDGTTEVLYVTTNNQLRVINGRTGSIERTISLPPVSSRFNRWEHAFIANFRGQGDVDLLLSASVVIEGNNHLRDIKIAAYSYDSLADSGAGAEALWTRNDFVSPSHSPPRVADLDLDGRDEVVGGIVVGHNGTKHVDIGVGNERTPHIDSIAIGDIDPDSPGLEVVAVEEGGQRRVIMYNKSRVLWSKSRRPLTDGDKAVIGDFDTKRRGLEIFLRGSNSDDMQVMDRAGNVIASYDFDTAKQPLAWTDEGMEVIFPIYWTGAALQFIVAKERHTDRKVGIFRATTGKNNKVFNHETAARLYVADLTGDWREEIVVVNSNNKLKIISNTTANPRPNVERLWNDPLYRRVKMSPQYYVTQ